VTAPAPLRPCLRRLAGAAALAALAAAAPACGGRQHTGAAESDRLFQCKGRSAEYIVVGGLGGDEVGVALDCADAGPRVRRWKVAQDGTREEGAKSMTPGEFDDVWARIEAAGWRNIQDCAQAAAQGDPVYTFDVKNDDDKASFSCSGRGQLPFPWGSLVDELDQAAARVSGHAHDDPGL
jgi:hypothetical protein